MLREAIRRLSGHTLTYAVAEQAARVAGFALLWLWTRHLSLEEFGAREILTVVLALLGQAAGINIVAGMSRLYFDEVAKEKRGAVVSTTLWTAGGVACLVAALLWLATPLAVRLMDSQVEDIAHLFRLTLMIFVFQMVREVQSKVLQTQERSRLYVSFALAKLALEIGLQVLFLVVLDRGLAGLLEAIVISEALFALLLAAVVLPSAGLAFSKPVLLGLASFTLPLIPNGLLQFALHHADRFLLLRVSGEAAVGTYGLAYKLGQLPNYALLGPFLLIWYPFVFSLREPERQRALIERLLPYFMGLMAAVTLLTALFARELVALVSARPEYHRAWTAVPVIALGYWFWGLFQLAQTGFYIQKRTGPLPRLTACAVLLNLGLNLALIPALGAMGAAIATALTFLGLALGTLHAGRAIFPLRIDRRRVLGPLVAAAVAFAVASFMGPRLGAWELPLKLACAAGWCAWAWAGGLLERPERQAARELVASVPARLRLALHARRGDGEGDGEG